MIQSAVSGLVFLVLAITLGPALFIIAFQMMSGQRVNLNGYVRGVTRLLRQIVNGLVSTCGSIGQAAANQVPRSHARWRPVVRVGVQVVLVLVVSILVFSWLASYAPETPRYQPPGNGPRYQPPPETREPAPAPPAQWIPPYQRPPQRP